MQNHKECYFLVCTVPCMHQFPYVKRVAGSPDSWVWYNSGFWYKTSGRPAGWKRSRVPRIRWRFHFHTRLIWSSSSCKYNEQVFITSAACPTRQLSGNEFNSNYLNNKQNRNPSWINKKTHGSRWCCLQNMVLYLLTNRKKYSIFRHVFKKYCCLDVWMLIYFRKNLPSSIAHSSISACVNTVAKSNKRKW